MERIEEMKDFLREAKALARYKGGSEAEKRDYVKVIEGFMNSMGESLDGYDEYMEMH